MLSKTILLFCIIFLSTATLIAQPAVIISTKGEYKTLVKTKPTNRLVDLKKLIPGLLLDLKYATKDNFTNTILYNHATTSYLVLDAANALYKVQEYLKMQGYRLVIYDAYRPYSVTKQMWDLIKDEKYVANPKNGSGHNRGTSVDLSIVNSISKEALAMGTPFDNFTALAHHSYTAHFDSTIRANRHLLKSTMEMFGFKSLETEWWHYSFISSEKYEVFDLSFKILKRL